MNNQKKKKKKKKKKKHQKQKQQRRMGTTLTKIKDKPFLFVFSSDKEPWYIMAAMAGIFLVFAILAIFYLLMRQK